MTFEETFDKASKEVGGGSQFWKPEEGDNKFRILAEPEINVSVFDPKTKRSQTCYEEAEFCTDAYIAENDMRKSVKFLTWIAVDGELRLYNMPYSVTKQLIAFKRDDEYAFESFPAPYDVNLKVANAGTKEVEYTLVPARQNTEVDESLITQLEEKEKSVGEIVELMKSKARGDVDLENSASESA